MNGADSGRLPAKHDQHAPALLRYAQLLTSDRVRAAEVAQQIMLRAARDPEVADAPARSVRAWFFSNARNVLADDRPERREPEEINAEVDRLLLSDALSQLPAADRAVLRHAYYRRRTTAQIAADLDIAEETVKSRMHAASRALWPRLRELGVAPL